ncbi:beta strand repeat-containing protein [Prescottella equi]|uniref:beta strand repeat-containing protein n=1 Tax=Rhodococcus hoagii TaxID=43767 RepID=UPI003D956521
MSTFRRLAAPLVAGVAAVGLIVAGSGTAMAADPPPAWSGDKTADNLRWNLSLSAVNGAAVDRTQVGVNVVYPGDTVTYTAKIWKNSGIGRYITTIRQIAPAGFQYQSNTVSKQSTVTNEGTAGVKATCSGGGCNSVPVLGNKGYLDNVDFAVTYKIPDTQAAGDYNAGFLFDVYSFSTGQGTNPAGAWVRVADPVPTTTTVQTPGSATTGEPVTLTATVDPANADGQVQFKDGASNIGSPVTPVNGVATLTHTFDTAGSHAITAQFTAGRGFDDSTSTVQTVAVSNPDVATSLSLSAPASAETGSSVDLTATVTPANAQGSVQFTDNGAPIGSPVPVASGSATLPHTFTSVGTHSLAANFTAAAGFTNSSATAQNVTVVDPDIETTLSVTVPGTAETGQPVTLSAAVTPPTAQGDVQFKVDGNPVGAPQAVSDGSASLPYTFDAAGSFEVTADFTGASGFTNASAAAQTVTVSVPDVVTSLTLDVPATAVTGTPVELAATVSPSGAQGTVQFTDDGTPIGAPVAVVNDVATLPYTFTDAGSHSVGASFTAGPGFTDAAASSPASIVVSDPDQQTTTTVTVPGAAQTGTAVMLEATVAPAPSAGTVQFQIGGVDVGAPVTVSGGAASLPWTFDAAGSFAVTAVYSGATGFEGSTSAPQSVAVSDPDVTTSLTVQAPATAVTGTSVDLTATVSPSNAQGTVQFEIDGVPVGSPQTVSGGAASLPYTFNAADTHAVTAEFTGAAGFTNSTASAQTVTVSDPAPVDVATSTLVGVPGSATTGAPTTLSVTVQAQSGSAVPTGSVQFRENGSPIGSPVVLVNGSASVDHIFTVVGTRQVSAVYTADAGFVGSASVDRPVVVSAPNPSDAVSSVVIVSTQSPTAGAPYVLKAQVIGAPSLPGTVQFFDGGVEIGAPVPVVDGVAELTHTFTQSGPRQVHAVYSGGTGVAGSTSVTQTLDVVQSGGGTGGTGSLDLGSLGSLNGFRFGF